MQIVSLALNLVLGSGLLVTLNTLRATRRKSSAEADNVEVTVRKDKVELVDSTVDTMIKTVNSLMEQNKELIDMYASKSDELEITLAEKKALSEKVYELEKRVNRMIQTNLKVIKVLEQIGVDEHLVNQLKESTK